MTYNEKYSLTVLVSSYNQEKYIEEAIESVLKQDVNFKYQVVIADDCSTDSTLSIINKYIEKYDFIFLDQAETNKGIDNYIVHLWDVWKTLDTEYIALLDADDFWIDNNKLQEQYDVLQDNSDVVVVGDSFFLYDYKDPYIHANKVNNRPVFSQTSTLFFRNIIDLDLFPKILRDDGGLPFIFACYGDGRYRNKITSFYRAAENSLYSLSSQIVKDNVNTYLTCIALSFVLSKKDQNIPIFNQYLINEYRSHDISFIKDMLNKIQRLKNEDLGSKWYFVQKEDFFYLNILEQDLLKRQQHIILNINKLQDTEVRLQDTEVKLQNTEVRLQDTEVKLQNTEVKLQNTEVKLQNTEVRLQDTEVKLRDTGVKLQDTEVKLRDANLSINERTTYIASIRKKSILKIPKKLIKILLYTLFRSKNRTQINYQLKVIISEILKF